MRWGCPLCTTPTHVGIFVVFNSLRWKAVVRFLFIDGIVDHHYLNFLFITHSSVLYSNRMKIQQNTTLSEQFQNLMVEIIPQSEECVLAVKKLHRLVEIWHIDLSWMKNPHPLIYWSGKFTCMIPYLKAEKLWNHSILYIPLYRKQPN